MFSRKILLTLIVTIFVGVLLELWTVNRLSSLGGNLENIGHSQQVLQMENNRLKNQIDETASLQRLSEMAKGLGYIEVKNVTYLSHPNLALK